MSIQQGRLNVPVEDICGEQTVLGGMWVFNVYRLSMKICRTLKLVLFFFFLATWPPLTLVKFSFPHGIRLGTGNPP